MFYADIFACQVDIISERVGLKIESLQILQTFSNEDILTDGINIVYFDEEIVLSAKLLLLYARCFENLILVKTKEALIYKLSSPLQSIMLADFEGVVAHWCNHLVLQPEQSGGQRSVPGRALPHEGHDKGS